MIIEAVERIVMMIENHVWFLRHGRRGSQRAAKEAVIFRRAYVSVCLCVHVCIYVLAMVLH